MSFFTVVPVIGHFKGIVDYVFREKEEAIEELIKANRTTYVAVAATLGGAAGGPPGAMLAAACFDTAVSIAGKKPRGLVKNIYDIHNDISNDRMPIRSSIDTALTLGEDALTGYAGPRIIRF